METLIAEKKDLKEILELQYLAYQSEAKLLNNYDIPPLKQTLKEMEKEFYNGMFLKFINDNNIIIGSVRVHKKEGTSYIGKLIVHPNYQKRGIGTKLLQEIEKLCVSKRYELFTSSKSLINIKFYEKAGYKIFKEQKINENLKFIYLEKIV